MRFLLIIFVAALALVNPIARASLLYQISGNELSKPSYLFGTMHVLCAEDFWLPAQLDQRFAEVDQLVMELDLSSAEVLLQSAKLMNNRHGPYLEAQLDSEQLLSVEHYLHKNLAMSLAQAQRMNPFLLSTQIMLSQLPCNTTASYEGHLVTLAMAANKPISGLETVAFQMSLFDQIPLSTQVAMIWQLINAPVQAVAEFKTMTDFYLQQDIEQLYQFIVNDPTLGDFQPLILDQRNQDWLTKLPAIMQQQPAMIAVGAGHLGGDQGLVNLLRQAGYQVTPIN
jgi:uncharacterized protein YbaP (TraB family)